MEVSLGPLFSYGNFKPLRFSLINLFFSAVGSDFEARKGNASELREKSFG